ncbi:hypothetical protein IWQ60_003054 [Tieghemiomyces parasiticus]|uniref:Uncharacterized protein n=1 Tax=Tieghemiomyces parasiticus TaxID=78921 RepID=A0A9W8E0J4_9FUNG|nr:hypothetical protein IWQ60_003054 [Tieghemiomyces parasiticus]
MTSRAPAPPPPPPSHSGREDPPLASPLSTSSSGSDDSGGAFEDAQEFPDKLQNSSATQPSRVRDSVPLSDLSMLSLHGAMPHALGSKAHKPSQSVPVASLPAAPLLTPSEVNLPQGRFAASTNGSGSPTGSDSGSGKKGKHHGLKGLLRRTTQQGTPRATTSPGPDRANPDARLDSDIQQITAVLGLFLDSRLQEAEDAARRLQADSLYGSLGYGLILYLKAVMTFEDENIQAAMDALKVTFDRSARARKDLRGSSNGGADSPGAASSASSFVGGFGSGMMDTLGGFLGKNNGAQGMRTMTRNQLHAELVHAETTLLRAVLNIYSEDGLINFLKEGLHVRSSYLVYRDFGKFLDWAALPENADVRARVLDDHLVSGIVLGLAIFNLILSLLPAKYLRVVEIFGFTGNRDLALGMLEVACGWRAPGGAEQVPAIYASPNGLRRPFSDMVLLFYHTVFASAFPVSGVNIRLAQRIIAHHLSRHQHSVIFMYFGARTHQILAEVPSAVVEYQYTIKIQSQWVQIQHLCYWELIINHFAMLQFQPQPIKYLDILIEHSRWSKAVYAYVRGACFLQTGAPAKTTREAIDQVAGFTQKIGGKSIPVEKFVARKARKFFMQQQHLLLPVLEMMVVWNACNFMPVNFLWQALAMVDGEIARLERDGPQPNIHYYDDVCLAHMLRGVILRELIVPTSDGLRSNLGTLAPSEYALKVNSLNQSSHALDNSVSVDEPVFTSEHLRPILTDTGAEAMRLCRRRYEGVSLDHECVQAFFAVFQNAYRIDLDHYLFYMTHYQLGLYYLAKRACPEAKTVFEAVVSGSSAHSFQFPTLASRYPEELLPPSEMRRHPAPSCYLSEEADPGDAPIPAHLLMAQSGGATPVVPSATASPALGATTNHTPPPPSTPPLPDATTFLSSLGLTKRKGKYSLQNMITLKSYNAIQKIDALAALMTSSTAAP